MTTQTCLEQFESAYISIYGTPLPDWIRYLVIELCSANFSQAEIQDAVSEALYSIYVRKIEVALRRKGVPITKEARELIDQFWGKSKPEEDAIKEIENQFQPKPKTKTPGSSLC